MSMHLMKKIILSLAIVLLPWRGLGTVDANLRYYFTHIDNSNGLSENCVKSITQDRWGFVWIGTKNGLNRYDGHGIKHYTVTDYTTGHGNQNISALCEDGRGRLWVGTDKGVFILDPVRETFTALDIQSQDGKHIKNWIAQITADNLDRIWIVSPTEGIFLVSETDNGKQMVHYATRRKDEDKTYEPQCLCIRPDGDVWIGTAGQGIFQLDWQTGRMRQMKDGLEGEDIYTIKNYGEWLLIGEHEGQLRKFHPEEGILTTIEATNAHYKVIRAIDVSGDEIFVATQNGLYIINEQKHTEEHLHEDNIMPNSLRDDMLYTLYRDRHNGLWIGTMLSGACYMPHQGLHFYSYIPTERPHSLSNKHIREMLCDSKGHIWIATEEGHLNIFYPERQEFEVLNTPQYKGGTNRLALMADGHQIWSGLFKNGLDIINQSSHQVTHYSPQQMGLTTEGSVYALLKDRNGRVWLGTGRGVYIKDGPFHFNKVMTLPDTDIFTQDIVQDHNGYIWLATIGNGVFRYDPQSGQADHFMAGEGTISSNDVSSITIDHQGRLWFATDRGGVSVYNPVNCQWRSFGTADGLPDDVVYKVLEDSLHRLWMGTNHGLVCGDLTKGFVTVYQNEKGLPGNQYNYKSAVAGADGAFYFGGTNGLTAFYPLLADRAKPERLFITDMQVDRKTVMPSDDGILQTNIVEAKEIHLPYNFASLQFQVSSLDFSGVERDNYEYQLTGVDREWMLLRGEHQISFSRLPPGTYTLLLRLVGSETVTSLDIIVAHPWWSAPLMRLVYLLLAGALVYAAFLLWSRRQKERIIERQQRFIEEKDKELLQEKIKFFTDITHEIRTPLTLINGSIENISEEHVDNPVVSKNMAAISKNTHRLLHLTNQLLDFRKVDTHNVTLHFTNIGFFKLIMGIVEGFEPTINRQHKTISVDMEDEQVVLQADREAVTKIISNLLENARKYSETFIQVMITANDEVLTLRTINDGSQIPSDKADEIFRPFAQLDSSHMQSGSGLGLPMARSLAEMHGGSLTLNTQSEYNEFVLTLPLRQAHLIEMDETQGSVILPGEVYTADDDMPLSDNLKEYTLLVVEDNEEILRMVDERLEHYYHVVTAKDGAEGLEAVLHHHIDLVISDIMMPGIDGLEMCRRMKDDVETSHIPIVMLTAKQTLDNRMEGLRAGADAYIEKPFSFAHLHTQIETLLSNRRRERENFVRRPYLSVQSGGISKVEEQFISKITQLITANIRQPEFSVEQLAADMCMSRSSLHRKIKEISDMTPTDFIRLIRLKKAAELIQEHGYRANEVCGMVGISSVSYFIKLFQKQFGMTPKEFAQRKGQSKDNS